MTGPAAPQLPLALLAPAALVAFAANSVLARGALATGEMDPAGFTAVRLVAGALMLAALLALRGGLGAAAKRASPTSAAALLAYALLFSFAYVGLDAGLGALILFGAVQVTMFAGGLIGGERPGPARWVGMAAGMAGLAWLGVPGAAAPSPMHALLMAGSGAAWGVYSLRGRGSRDPLADTGAAFVLAAVPAAVLGLLIAAPGATATGWALAIASGAITSGLGYAIWYAALPRLDASLAAVAQLTVPLIALAGGMIWLGEAPGPRFAVSGVLILGGVALAALAPSRARLRRPAGKE